MTRQELRVFLDEWFCGCGSPALAARTLRDLLTLHPLYDNRPAFEKLIPDEGLQYLILYTLDRFDLTEHGGTIGGAWLTDKGRAVLQALNRDSGDDFATLMEQACSHGYAVETELLDCPECAELNRHMHHS